MRRLQGFAFNCIAVASAVLIPGFATAAPADPPENAARVLPHAVAVSAGAHHTCALTDAGGVMCWGWNDWGQLGDGTTTDRHTPVAVRGLESGVTAIAAGFIYTCALMKSGQMKCWGGNDDGELGDGTTTGHLTPETVKTLRSVQAIAAGPGHTCAVEEHGGLCWGDNYFGELGDGTTTDRLAPVVYERVDGIAGISTSGYGHSCDVRSGFARCWGSNSGGQLGDGTTTDHHAPALVVGLSAVAAIAAGYLHTCALTESGGVKCWGENSAGQLGDGTTTGRLSPVAVRGMNSGIKAVGGGFAHTCALLETGAIKCWGGNTDGELGNGTMTTRITPGFVKKFHDGGAVAITVGNEHNCAVTESGGVRCWGRNDSGQLGDGTTTDRLTPVRVRGFPR